MQPVNFNLPSACTTLAQLATYTESYAANIGCYMSEDLEGYRNGIITQLATLMINQTLQEAEWDTFKTAFYPIALHLKEQKSDTYAAQFLFKIQSVAKRIFDVSPISPLRIVYCNSTSFIVPAERLLRLNSTSLNRIVFGIDGTRRHDAEFTHNIDNPHLLEYFKGNPTWWEKIDKEDFADIWNWLEAHEIHSLKEELVSHIDIERFKTDHIFFVSVLRPIFISSKDKFLVPLLLPYVLQEYERRTPVINVETLPFYIEIHPYLAITPLHDNPSGKNYSHVVETIVELTHDAAQNAACLSSPSIEHFESKIIHPTLDFRKKANLSRIERIAVDWLNIHARAPQHTPRLMRVEKVRYDQFLLDMTQVPARFLVNELKKAPYLINPVLNSLKIETKGIDTKEEWLRHFDDLIQYLTSKEIISYRPKDPLDFFIVCTTEADYSICKGLHSPNQYFFKYKLVEGFNPSKCL